MRILRKQLQLPSFFCAVHIQYVLVFQMLQPEAELDDIWRILIWIVDGDAAGITAPDDLQLLTQIAHFPVFSSHAVLRIK